MPNKNIKKTICLAIVMLLVCVLCTFRANARLKYRDKSQYRDITYFQYYKTKNTAHYLKLYVPLETNKNMRGLTMEELEYFIQLFNEEKIYNDILSDDLHTPGRGNIMAQFMMYLPTGFPDVCHNVEGEDDINWLETAVECTKNPTDYYYASGDDVRAIWAKYAYSECWPLLDYKRDLNTFYYRKELDRYYFPSFCHYSRFTITDGITDGDYVYLYSLRNYVLFRKVDDHYLIVERKPNEYPEQHSIADRMTRLTAQQLYDMDKAIYGKVYTGKFIDGYQQDNYYLIFTDNDMCIYKSDGNQYISLQKNSVGDWWEKNAAEDEGLKEHVHFTVREDYIPHDNTKGSRWNDAIDAYNRYVCNMASTKEKMDYAIEYNVPGLFCTNLSDLNDDGVPELIISEEDMWPESVYTYKDGIVLALPGRRSNGQHGYAGIRSDGVYESEHHTTGFSDSYITYNRDGSCTEEVFQGYNSFIHYRIIHYYNPETRCYDISKEVYSKEYSQDQPDEFYRLQKKYSEAGEKIWFSPYYYPYVPVWDESYSPYAKEQYYNWLQKTDSIYRTDD